MKEIKVSKKEAKKGVSLVDKYREQKAEEKMAEKRHQKYVDFTKQTTIRRDIVNNIMAQDTIATNQNKQKLKNRKNPKKLLFKKFKPKPKQTSIFSDADFANVAGSSQSNSNLMQGFTRVR